MLRSERSERLEAQKNEARVSVQHLLTALRPFETHASHAAQDDIVSKHKKTKHALACNICSRPYDPSRRMLRMLLRVTASCHAEPFDSLRSLRMTSSRSTKKRS